MAIHTEQQNEINGGFNKEIDSSAMPMMLDVLQKYQYQYPIKSAIRELVSNGLDAISEREVARNILSGKNQVSDYFVEKEGEVFKDSKFDKDYYDLKYLTNDKLVHILYVEGKNSEKDYITIRDTGVGLGGKRLEKYFSLGYSTKRLNKHSLGKFGLGNKSPLSIMPYYTVESRYNGKLSRFNVYSGKVESLIPKYNLEKDTQNGEIVFSNGYILYFEETNLPNGLTITIECKKHHRQQYIDAVRSQLLYFDNVEMIVQRENSYNEVIDHKAEIFYEDEQIILSDNEYWAKPHLLINRVNYGFIDFAELELEQKYGNIGIKVEPELISINPSRESIIWDEQTKKLVLDKFQSVVLTATKFVQDELRESDFIKWMRICYQLSARYQKNSRDSVVSRLANIIDISQVQPVFPSDPRIKFTPTDILQGFECRLITLKHVKEGGKKVTKIDREKLKYGIGSYYHLPIFIMDKNASPRKDKYLISSSYPNGYITIKPPFWMRYDYVNLELDKFLEKVKSELELGSNSSPDGVYHKLKDVSSSIWDLLKKSSETIQYESVIVPDDFKATDKDEDEEVVTEEDKQEQVVSTLTHEERRKAQGKTVVHALRHITNISHYPPKDYQYGLYEWQKLEIPIVEINSWNEEEIYYGNDSDNDLLKFAAFISRPQDTNSINDSGRGVNNHRDWCVDTLSSDKLGSYGVARSEAHKCTTFFERTDVKMFKVAQANNKLYRDFKPIQKFFLDIQNGVITMSNVLIKWNTARQIKERLHKLNFLYNFPFDKDKQEQYHKLVAYVKAHYKEVGDIIQGNNVQSITPTAYNDLLDHLGKVQQFQMFVAECEDATHIAELAKEIWKQPTITNGNAIELDVWKEFEELLDWADPIQPLCNEIPCLTGFEYRIEPRKQFDQWEDRREPDIIGSELEFELRNYLVYKNVLK